MRPGYRLIVIDLSAAARWSRRGRPLRPGSYVDVQLETDARRGMVAARVVRCAVAAIDSESGVTYRAGLWFNATLRLGPRSADPSGCMRCPATPRASRRQPPPAGTGYPRAAAKHRELERGTK